MTSKQSVFHFQFLFWISQKLQNSFSQKRSLVLFVIRRFRQTIVFFSLAELHMLFRLLLSIQLHARLIFVMTMDFLDIVVKFLNIYSYIYNVSNIFVRSVESRNFILVAFLHKTKPKLVPGILRT
jgi:hypothetical protein